MHEDIDVYLEKLEYELDIEILGAWGTGSRARGLHTDESDYDISICFTQPRKNYIVTNDYIESISGPASNFIQDQVDSDIPIDLVEFEGWDVKRFVELIKQSNQNPFDCFASHIRYRQHPAFNMMGEYCNEHLHPIDSYIGFQNEADRIYNERIQNQAEPTVKRNLLLIESVLRAKYVKHTHEYPPMNFFVLVDELSEINGFGQFNESEVRELAQRKLDGEKNEDIGNPFQQEFESFRTTELEYEEHIPDSTVSSDELNMYIRNIISD